MLSSCGNYLHIQHTSNVFSRDLIATFTNGIIPRAVPYCVRKQSLASESGLPLRGVRLWNPLISPPWQLHCPTVDTSLATFKKNDISPDESHSKALELIASYEGYVKTYTDGSKASEGVGCSFIQGNERRSFTLPSHASVFTAELVAILKAVCFIEVTDGDNRMLFSLTL